MEELFTTKELSGLLKVHPKTIYNWRSEGMPFKMIGRGVRFELDKVNEWLASKEDSNK